MKNITITLSADNASMLLISATRYALGRRTYIVSWTCEMIRAIAAKIPLSQRKVLIQDISECKDYGHTCDERDWKTVLQWLETLK